MTAALPWYPAAAEFWNALWRAMIPHLEGAPDRLHWPEDLAAHWSQPDIWITQTCAPIWKTHYQGRLHAVGSFDFGLSAPGTYRSALVTRREVLQPLCGASWRVAVNGFDSQSGWGALGGIRIQQALRTGSHECSMRAVAQGRADLAAIDGITWRLAPHRDLVVRAWTLPTPAPPVLTSDPARIPALVKAFAAALPQVASETIGLRGFIAFDAAHYAATPDLPALPRCIRAETAA